MFGNPQGPNVLANEFIGGLVTSAVGLPVAQGRLVHLSEDFIDQNPGLWFETPQGRRRPESGIHFGSMFVGQPEGLYRPTDYISRSRIRSIRNRDAFLGMYILDIWANHQDNRQALLTNLDAHESEIRFIDHGHMFAGPHWRFSERPGLASHLERSVYSDLWSPYETAGWVFRFENAVPAALSRAVSLLPTWWYSGNVDLLHYTLMQRLADLAELIERERTGSHQAIQRSTTNGTLRIPHFGIHMFGAAI
jgi:hypothetical protein